MIRGRSIVWRAIQWTVLVSCLSSLALAAGAALTARVLWRAREKDELRQSCAAFFGSMKKEAVEDSISLENAAAGAIDESALAGHQIEVWRASKLIATSSTA